MRYNQGSGRKHNHGQEQLGRHGPEARVAAVLSSTLIVERNWLDCGSSY
ncbi:MAG: hypothetical protein ACJ70W_09585 [Nitrososphaera sp.]